MKRPRVRFSVELDTSMSRDVDYWTNTLIDVIHGDNRTNGDHPFIAFDSVIEPRHELGDVLDTAAKVEALPRGSAIEGGGLLYQRAYEDDEPWACINNNGGCSYAASHEIPLPAIVRFVS